MFSVLVLSGHADVLQQASLLEELAERLDQPASMNWLAYFVHTSSFHGKEPYLVLILEPGVHVTRDTASSLTPDQVHAAVLLFEYRAFGRSSGAFCTDDWTGFRTVVAPKAERAAMAALAADTLLEHGAHLVLISYVHPVGGREITAHSFHRASVWATLTRTILKTLPLAPTLEATLATLGKSTRFNLGYYRRRLNAVTPCNFHADVRGLEKQELLEINRRSLNPVDDEEFLLRYDSACNLPGGYLLGLRTESGDWISLIGGWRQGQTTVLQWQMNASGYEKLSIGTAMRSYFIEHEMAIGTRTLIYYGGTRHSMGNSFIPEEATDLIVRRGTLRASVLYRTARLLESLRPRVRVNSQLVQSVGDRSLKWNRAGKRRSPGGPEPDRTRV